jgi:ABC-type molybdenum transport system ATPase subunit/photorepair protein PhrA
MSEQGYASQQPCTSQPTAPSHQTTPLFQIHDATVMRSGRTILHVDDFQMAEGESIALLGPNGAGKSTFIQLLTHEIRPLYHEVPPVLFRGNDHPLITDIRSCLGIVSSTMASQATVHAPAIDIVCGGLFGTLGLPRQIHATDADRQQAYDALDRLGMAELAHHDVTTLSTGQFRRVLIARELIHNPQVLVFDEPCTGLDPEGMYQVRKTMRQLAAEGCSVILVTHYPEDIIPAIKRVLLIKEARLYADGPKEELLTGQEMTHLFGVPLEVESDQGWYALRGIYE